MFQGDLAGNVVIEDQDSNLAEFNRGCGAHFLIIVASYRQRGTTDGPAPYTLRPALGISRRLLVAILRDGVRGPFGGATVCEPGLAGLR